MKKFLFVIALVAVFLPSAWGQSSQEIILDATTNGTVIDLDPERSNVIYDDGGPEGNYSANTDRYVTVAFDCGAGRLCIQVTELSLNPKDTIYIYDGAGIGGLLRAKICAPTSDWKGKKVFVSPNENTNQITVRFRADSTSTCAAGFVLGVDCGVPCEKVVPVIDSLFYRTRNGVVYDSAYIHDIPFYDTTYTVTEEGDTTSMTVDTGYFLGANLCIGDGVIFHGRGEYSFDHGYYTPSDSTTFFHWDMANAGDSVVGYGVTEIAYADYQATGCYDMSLSLKDEFGCESTVYTSVKVRTAQNPIKTLFSLSHICNNASLMVNMGYDGENATLTLRKVEANQIVSKINEVRVFIPDGKCIREGVETSCYEAPVTFTEFPAGKSITKKEDICSICINMEHTYMGDLTMSIICPSGQEAYFFFGNQDAQHRPNEIDEETGEHRYGINGGGFKYMGYPIENDGLDDSSNKCDSLRNPFGIGLDYCFSRNPDYVLVTGDLANQDGHPQGDWYIVSNGYMDNFSEVIPPIPSWFTNSPGATPTSSGTTKHPSDHVNKVDYYLPYTDFSELVGCPLNGEWRINVCDFWGVDNGWVFNWSMDICNVTQDNDCKYEVAIDSLVWRPNRDTIYYDYELGHYRGLVVERESPSVSYLMTPDTAGTFPIDVMVYDEFGCVWHDSTAITSFWTPEPSLGPDTALCGDTQMPLDATDRHMNTQNYTFTWEPFGQDTPTIITQTEPSGDVRYVARVINTQDHGYKKCERRDTINVRLRKQPLPSFNPTPFVLEGCAPLTITFDNNSTNADFHKWIFGDGITSELRSPTHSYDVGVFDVKYYATSADGCVDSLIFDRLVASYSAPKASFAWEPVYPSVLNPEVHLSNLTTPQSVANKYFWEIQYNLNNPISVETVTEETVDFDFSTYAENENIAGNYTVRLITRTDNMAPSGNIVYCRDTAENTILVINDFIQFPNVVTPNGDGINDRFVIRNLIEGMGYPTNALYIYNKWGSCVYKKENISTYDDFWDPSNVPSGTYFYRFTARGYNGNIEHSGAIEVIK